MNATVEHYAQQIPGFDGACKPLEVRAPYDQQLLATVDMASEAAIEAALTNADRLFRDRSQWLPADERIAILERAMVWMKEEAETLARGAAAEGGKPLIDSRIEMARCIDSFRICIDTLRTDCSAPPVMGVNAASRHRMAMMQREPIGVVVAVSAFNHPLNLIAHQVGPAIASGCPVIVKPAPDTPLSCLRLLHILYSVGLPQAWCQCLLPESNRLAERLVCDPRVAFFSFIGSAKVGWMLRAKLAPGTRCALEHGGVAPVIVAADADLDAALPGLVKGAFYHAGQVCVSVQRIYAHATIARPLAEALAQRARALIVGDPLDAASEVGPLIRPNEVTRVDAWVQAAVENGGELVCGGQPLAHHCYAPTVIYDPPADATISTHEIFGPVVLVYPYTDETAAIAAANSLPVAFQAAVYSRDIDTALRLSNQLDASTVLINDHTAFRVDWMPFAGLKHSGLGTGGIPFTMRDMQIEKMTIIQSPSLP